MTVSEISGKLDALRVRRAELEARGEQLRTDLEDARRRQGRALADGASDTQLRLEVRSIDDELQATTTAVELLAADIANLEPQLVEGERQVAITLAEDLNRKATGALEDLDLTFRAFVTDVLLPLEEAWRARKDAAAAARGDAQMRSRDTADRHIGFTEGYREMSRVKHLAEALAAARLFATGETYEQARRNAAARRAVDAMGDAAYEPPVPVALVHESPAGAPWTPAHPHALDGLLNPRRPLLDTSTPDSAAPDSAA